jgi:hypothetical protein
MLLINEDGFVCDIGESPIVEEAALSIVDVLANWSEDEVKEFFSNWRENPYWFLELVESVYESATE